MVECGSGVACAVHDNEMSKNKRVCNRNNIFLIINPSLFVCLSDLCYNLSFLFMSSGYFYHIGIELYSIGRHCNIVSEGWSPK